MQRQPLIRFIDWLQRHPTWLVLAVVEVALGLQLGLPFLLENNLQRHDLVGHLSAAAFTERYLLHTVSGYNPFYFGGAPQNLLYPPLLAYLAAVLGRVLGVGLALRILIVAAVLATPCALYWCARAHSLAPTPAAIATLLATAALALCPEELGGNFLSTFETGNATNALSLPLVLGYAAALARWRRCPRAIVLPTILLGLNLLTHLVGGLVSILLLGASSIAAVRSQAPTLPAHAPVRESRHHQPRTLYPIGWVLLHAVGALALSSFFIVPLLAYRRFGSIDNRSYNQYPDSLLLLLASTVLLLGWYVSRRPERDTLEPLAILLGLLLLGRNFIFNDYFPRGLGLHVHRFKLYDGLLSILIACWLIEGWLESWPVRRRAMLAWAVVLVAGCSLVVGLHGIDARGTRSQEVPRLPKLPARVMVVCSPQHQASDHAVQHLVAMHTGNQVAKGLFVETAVNARFLIDLERLVAADPLQVRTWGVELDPGERIEPLRPALPSLLAVFGFGYVVANEPLHPEAGLVPMSDVGGGFTLYRANDTGLAEVWTGPIDTVGEDQFDSETKRWFFGPRDRLVIGLRRDQSWNRTFRAESVARARVKSVRTSAEEQSVTLDVDADGPVPVLVKFTYMPHFVAADDSGQVLPVYRVTPNLILVVGKGRITLHYELTALERHTRLVSMASLLLLLLFALGSAKMRHRRQAAKVQG